MGIFNLYPMFSIYQKLGKKINEIRKRGSRNQKPQKIQKNLIIYK